MTCDAQAGSGKAPEEIEHYLYLDSFRGIAIIGVVFTHIAVILPPLPPIFDNLTHFGSKGVQLFFMISGLTLAINYGGRSFSKAAFFEKRFFRIAPMYFLAAFFYAWFTRFGLAYGVKDLSLGSWLATFTFLSGWFPKYIITFVPGGWSISNEMTFYLFFPLLILLLARPVFLRVVAIATFAISVLCYRAIIASGFGGGEFNSYYAYFFWLTQLPAFVCGIVLCDAIPKLAKFKRQAGFLFAALSFLSVVCAASRGAFSSYIVADLLFFGLILSGGVSDISILRNALLVKIGRVSFSIYLIHFAVLSCMEPLTKFLVYRAGPVVALVLTYVLVFIIAFGISLLTYDFIERPGILLGKKLAGYRYRARRAVTEAAT